MVERVLREPRAAGLAVAALIGAWCLAPDDAAAQAAGLTPRLPDLSGIVKNEDWAKVLGKALFWDQQAGSDGMACASCHFHAGADSRVKNQLNPGFTAGDIAFGAIEGDLGRTASGALADSNYEVVADDFPFHRLADETDRNSDIIITTNDRMSSSGAYDRPFKKVRLLNGKEKCGNADGDIFHAGVYAARQVEPRNTPTVFNAAFFFRNFWDGRANNIFNGKNVFGRRDIAHDPTARILVKHGRHVRLETLELENASLASQAVGPPLSALEMSCDGRTFADVGRKLLFHTLRPLRHQKIHVKDSLLGRPGPFGNLRHWSGRGLKGHLRYRNLVRKAFHDKFWAAPGRFKFKDDGSLKKTPFGYTQMEHNFSMFWGIAIMLYESTLISDQSKFDTVNAALNGCMLQIGNPNCDPSQAGFTEKEADGFRLFAGIPGLIPGTDPNAPGGLCITCHGGPLFSVAAVVDDGTDPLLVARVAQPDGQGDVAVLEDFGFFNIGVRGVHEDVGIGGLDPYGNPLSFTRQYKRYRENGKDPAHAPIDGITVDPCQFAPPIGIPFNPADCTFEPTGPGVANERVKVDGGMKTPSLRNVALTPPYFHYGGYATLEQVIEFYARGGSRRDKHAPESGDDSGTGLTGEEAIPVAGPAYGRNTHDFIRPLNLALDPANGKDQHYGIEALAAFLRTITDDRVRCDVAPFDHPELRIPHGHKELDKNHDGMADDHLVKLPAVGKHGYKAYRPDLCIPNAGDLFAPGMLARVGR